MSTYADHHKALKEQLTQVQQALASVPKERRESTQDALERLEEALGFTAVAVDKTDPALVPDAARNEISGALTQIQEQVAAAGADPDSFTESLLNAVTRLPAARGEITAQHVKATVADVQRSATQRLNSLSKRIDATADEIKQLQANLDSKRAEWDEAVDARKAEFTESVDTRFEEFGQQLQELRGAVDAEKQRIETAAAEHADLFKTDQEKRAAEFAGKQAEYEEKLAAVDAAAKETVQALVEDIEEMKERSAQLVGAIGITGTAERYGNEANEQKTVADRLRIAAVASGLLAIAVAVIATHQADASTLAGQLVISAVLGGTATYLARQSGRHRGREERARNLQMDLTAFPVMSEALPEEHKIEETIGMIRRSFLGAQPARDHRNEPGPTPARQLIPRRSRSDES